MFRIDTSTAAGALPAAAPEGRPGFFSNGNPLTVTPATILSADWCNIVQEELMAPVLAAGMTPDKGNTHQVMDALLALAGAGGPQTVATGSGITLTASGLTFMLQCGSVTLGGGSNVIHAAFDFPEPFPSTPIAIVGTASGPASYHWTAINVTFPVLTATGAQVAADSTDEDYAITAGNVVRWIAIGIAPATGSSLS